MLLLIHFYFVFEFTSRDLSHMASRFITFQSAISFLIRFTSVSLDISCCAIIFIFNNLNLLNSFKTSTFTYTWVPSLISLLMMSITLIWQPIRTQMVHLWPLSLMFMRWFFSSVITDCAVTFVVWIFVWTSKTRWTDEAIQTRSMRYLRELLVWLIWAWIVVSTLSSMPPFMLFWWFERWQWIRVYTKRIVVTHFILLFRILFDLIKVNSLIDFLLFVFFIKFFLVFMFG